jgi:tetratricopeptide (TPR) repeat protein
MEKVKEDLSNELLRLDELRSADNAEPKDIADSLSFVAFAYLSLGETVNSLKYFEECLNIRKRLDNHPAIADSLNNIGLAHLIADDAQKALKYFEDSLELRKFLFSDNHVDIAQSLTNVGIAFGQLGNPANYMKYSYESLIMSKELDQDNSLIAGALFNLALAYGQLGEIDKLLKYSMESLNLYNELQDAFFIAHLFLNISFAFRLLDNPYNYLKYSLKALKTAEIYKNQDFTYDSLIKFSLLHVAKAYGLNGDEENMNLYLSKLVDKENELKQNYNFDENNNLFKNLEILMEKYD